MIPHRLRISSFHRQSVFILWSLVLIIIILVCNIVPISNSLSLALKFIPLFVLMIWLQLWFSLWGKVWILSTVLLIVGSQVNPNFKSGTLLLVHIVFLLGMMFLFDRRETQKQALHQRHLKTMQVLLRQNPPFIQTLDYTHEAVILLDNAGTIMEINSQSSFLLSVSESFLVGKPMYDVFGILPNFQPSIGPVDGEFTWQSKSGKEKQIKFRTRPFFDNGIPSGTLVTFFDISEARKRLETSIQGEKLSVINQVSAGLAHEIRNPLTTIKGFMQLIKPEQWPESFRPYQQLILDEIKTIDQLLNDFILLTSPTAPRVERLDLVETIPAVTQSIQPIVNNRGITLDFEFPSHSVFVMGDREQLAQAFLSILNNAIAASPEGEKVIISITEEEPCVRINFIDHGPGIPKNLRHRVLDPFFTTNTEKTGLGLTIAQQIIHAHHGNLHISELSSSTGTVVTIDFPSLLHFTGSLSA